LENTGIVAALNGTFALGYASQFSEYVPLPNWRFIARRHPTTIQSIEVET